ncbi:MAG: tRNA (N(6)-L-threonylcarbamoyladenosine(37)-C(2))-methylthiotransferase MtaB [Gemmataceae bacterium]
MTGRAVRLVTLGCKVNQYETQYVKELLEHAGWTEAAAGERAELCVVNTCTVTQEGDAKSRQQVRRLAQANPGADVVVMGCYATRDPASVASLPGVTRVVTGKARLAEAFAPYGVAAPLPGISRFDDHQRAFVKVEDGCLLRCSFCIIPSVRPALRSRPPGEIVDEVTRLVEAGYREVVLTGIHLGHYGIDLSKGRPKAEWTRLWHLLDRLAALPGDFRVRLSSLEAAEARDDLIRAMAGHPRVVPHLHLCLQSGSDRVLAAMRRRYRRKGYLERVSRIRAALDAPAFSTDVIVGFPGETDADFAETCDVLREAGLSRVHVFTYSPRQGTDAARLRDDVSPAVKAARREALRQLEGELAEQYYQSLIGRVLDVLVEGADDQRPGFARGTACRYAPVTFPGESAALLRQRVSVRALRVEGGVIVGEPLTLPPARARLPVVSPTMGPT